MSKAVLISIRPKWCELIGGGQKTVEVRKTRPKLEPPFKCYIYETRGFERVGNDNLNCVIGGSGRGMVIGEFVCDKLVWVVSHPSVFAGRPLLHEKAIKDACLTLDEAEAYSAGKDVFGWHIADLVIYDEPKDLTEFWRPACERASDCGMCPLFDRENMACKRVPFLMRPPQSWCYVEELT